MTSYDIWGNTEAHTGNPDGHDWLRSQGVPVVDASTRPAASGKTLHDTSDHMLKTTIHSLKAGLQTIIDGAVTPAGREWQHGATFHIRRNALRTMETEVRSRGGDPTHPSYGADVTGQIDEIERGL